MWLGVSGFRVLRFVICLVFGIWNLDFGFWILGFGFWGFGFGFWILGFGATFEFAMVVAYVVTEKAHAPKGPVKA